MEVLIAIEIELQISSSDVLGFISSSLLRAVSRLMEVDERDYVERIFKQTFENS